ncbi:MAG: 3-terminal-phosphate cyclase [Hydrocarboniphaga sp.]|uniref:RNA 3'-terminal phosphate cyclase n=1 Tax=Hydrocarboniphaga sp. TaxID=2033016 RepID=UPI00260CFA0B|nr:RNA 3'-terminal phosphate cyclase [Hydrocarboniphaga sp.]MDB5972808.1 3-terminal-phosphate cyclase [Hydrocarboniphaga sp.]
MLELNGAEGGGQLLRTALTLSICTGTPFRMTGIRTGRPKPGLMRQHLTAVEAAAAISGAEVRGANPGSLQLEFVPGPVRAGDYRFPIGTAGSTTLVLQTVLPALLRANSPSTLHLEGGTHNPMAPSVDFLTRAFIPVLRKMGAHVELKLERYGFYPAGGGSLRVDIAPGTLVPITLADRGALKSVKAQALISAVPGTVADRELAVVAQRLGLGSEALEHRSIRPAVGPGNVLMITIESENVSEVITSFGARGVTSEAVAERACSAARAYIDQGVVVGEHLADQILLPMALAGGGSFRTSRPSEHFCSNVSLISRFVPIDITVNGHPIGSFIGNRIDSNTSGWTVELK